MVGTPAPFFPLARLRERGWREGRPQAGSGVSLKLRHPASGPALSPALSHKWERARKRKTLHEK
jgi:hypothetical protein